MLNNFIVINQRTKIEYTLQLLLKIVCVCIFVILVIYHLRLINYPFPLEIREGGDLLSIKALHEKINPYDLSNQPIYSNPYGIVYPYLAQKVSFFAGTTLFTARLLSAISIFFTLILIFVAFKKERIDFWTCVAGIIIFYTNILFFVTPLCRPDSLGMTFFFLSILLPIWFRFNYFSLFTGLLFSLLAFYTKQYFIIGYFFIIIYVLLFVSIKKASIFLTTFISLLIASLFIFDKYFECYLFDTIFTHIVVSNNDLRFALHQLRVFFFTNSGLTLILLASLLIVLFTKNKFDTLSSYRNSLKRSIHLFYTKLRYSLNWKNGLLDYHLNPYIFLFWAILFCLLFKLGGNTGAFMTYYYQLLSFPFIILAIKQPYKFSKPLFILFLLINFYTSGKQYLFQNNNNSTYNSEWQKANELILSSKNVFSTAEVSPLIIQHGEIPYNTGYTEFSISSTLSPKISKMFPFTEKIKYQNSRYDSIVREKITKKMFDRLIINDDYSTINKDFLNYTYTIRDSITLDYYHSKQKIKLYVWEPIL